MKERRLDVQSGHREGDSAGVHSSDACGKDNTEKVAMDTQGLLCYLCDKHGVPNRMDS